MIFINEYENLIKNDITCNYLEIKHFIDNSNNYRINIICCEFKDKSALKENWRGIIDNIAFYIQTKLEKLIELYNLYVIFFIEDIDKELIYCIEQDRYSSRKIVLTQKMPKDDEILIKLIKDRLFKVYVEEINESIELDKIVEDYNRDFYKCISNIKSSEIDEEFLENIIDFF